MSGGFPFFEPAANAQLLIVHMDDSVSTFLFAEDCEQEGWRTDMKDGLQVTQHGGYTVFPWGNIKSYTMVYENPDIAKIQHLDPDLEGLEGDRDAGQ